MAIIRHALAVFMFPLLFVIACGDDADTNGSFTATPATSSTGSPVPESDLPLPDPWEIRIAEADGSREALLYVDDQASSFAWSPDGSRLAIATSEFAGTPITTTVRFVDLDGSQLRQVTRGTTIQDIEWTDKQRLRFSTYQAGL
jgi:hypothetical protein